MKKSFNIICLVLALVLSGCSSSSKSNEITIWHTFTEHHEEMLQEIISEYNSKQDAFKVVAVTNPLDGFASKVYEALSNGTGPDMIMLDAATGADYVELGLTIDFSEYLTDEDYKDRVSVGTYEESTGYDVDGLHCLAIQQTGPVMFYNKTMYDSLGLVAPDTFEQLESNSKAIYEAYGIPGFAVDTLEDLAIALMKQSGNDVYNETTGEIDFGSDNTIEWLESFAKGVNEGYYQLAPTTGDYNSGDIAAKVLASYVGSSAGLAYVDLGEDELACAPLPQLNEENKWAVEWNRNIFGFTGTQEKDEAIVDFSKFFISDEVNAKWSETFGGLSPYQGVKENESYVEYVSNNIALEALQQQSEYAGSLPIFKGTDSLRTELNKMMSRTATNLSTASDALKEAITACQELVK